jgi:hypothetical protein
LIRIHHYWEVPKWKVPAPIVKHLLQTMLMTNDDGVVRGKVVDEEEIRWREK